MGEIRIKFCCGCGVQTDALMQYWQYTDFQKRSSEAHDRNNMLELCDACLEKAKSDFQAKRKFLLPLNHNTEGIKK